MAEKSAYEVWISEIMLQQTQVETVIPYYKAFIKTFPQIKTLAVSSEEQIMSLWSGWATTLEQEIFIKLQK